MLQRNKGDTIITDSWIKIPSIEVIDFKKSLINLLQLVELEKCDRAQQSDIKNIFKLLDYFSENQNPKSNHE